MFMLNWDVVRENYRMISNTHFTHMRADDFAEYTCYPTAFEKIIYRNHFKHRVDEKNEKPKEKDHAVPALQGQPKLLNPGTSFNLGGQVAVKYSGYINNDDAAQASRAHNQGFLPYGYDGLDHQLLAQQIGS